MIKRFKKALKEEKIELEDKDGKVAVYSILEMDGNSHADYVNEVQSVLKMDRNGNVLGVKNMKDFIARLLTRCMVDADGNAVSSEFVNALPSSVLQELQKIGQELSGLDVASEELAGNG